MGRAGDSIAFEILATPEPAVLLATTAGSATHVGREVKQPDSDLGESRRSQCCSHLLRVISLANKRGPSTMAELHGLLKSDGTCLVETEEMGTVVVATASFAPGEVVIKEVPLLLYETTPSAAGNDDWTDFFRQYSKLSPDDKTRILAMAHPELDGQTIRVKNRKVESIKWQRILRESCGLEAEVIQKLMLIADTNSHLFLGAASSHNSNAPKAALCVYGSKVEHSCSPNVSYSSSTGYLIYRAIRRIEIGERISFSYIDLKETAAKRREILLETKDFVCSCDLCLGPDHSRTAGCPKPTCQGTALIHSSGEWECTTCGFLSASEAASILKTELEFERRLGFMQAQQLQANIPDSIHSVIADASRRLSPTHSIVARLVTFYSTICASHLAMLNKPEIRPSPGLIKLIRKYCSPMSTVDEVSWACAMSGLTAVRIGECIAAKCHGCESSRGLCGTEHDPVYSYASETYYALDEMAKHLHSASPFVDKARALFVRVIGKYRELLGVLWGFEDADFLRLDTTFKRHSSASVATREQAKTCDLLFPLQPSAESPPSLTKTAAGAIPSSAHQAKRTEVPEPPASPFVSDAERDRILLELLSDADAEGTKDKAKGKGGKGKGKGK